MIALKKFMVDVPIITKDPVVLCLETVIEKDACAVKDLSRNRLNSLSIKSMPLGDELAKAIDEGRIGKVLATRPNMLVSSCRNVNNLNDVQDSIDFAFQIASKEGMLANENMMDICFIIYDAMLSNCKHRGVDEIIPTTKSVMYGSQLTAKPQILKPVYLVEIQSTKRELPRIRHELNYHGEVD